MADDPADFHHSFPRSEGREVFGGDPAGYERARPGYPERVYELLVERCGLVPGTATLEIGPGPGTASMSLIARGARPYVAVEPDPRLAEHLESRLRAVPAEATVHVQPFEDAPLGPQSFDLVAAATSFHWIEPKPGLKRVFTLLRPGGWWAMWWTIFNDPEREDPFHEVTHPLLQRATGEEGPSDEPFVYLQNEERIAELVGAGFRAPHFEAIRFTRSFTPGEIRDLYATFSPVSRLAAAPRAKLLDDLERVAADTFGGRVERPFVTACYVARRPD